MIGNPFVALSDTGRLLCSFRGPLEPKNEIGQLIILLRLEYQICNEHHEPMDWRLLL